MAHEDQGKWSPIVAAIDPADDPAEAPPVDPAEARTHPGTWSPLSPEQLAALPVAPALEQPAQGDAGPIPVEWSRVEGDPTMYQTGTVQIVNGNSRYKRVYVVRVGEGEVSVLTTTEAGTVKGQMTVRAADPGFPAPDDVPRFADALVGVWFEGDLPPGPGLL